MTACRLQYGLQVASVWLFSSVCYSAALRIVEVLAYAIGSDVFTGGGGGGWWGSNPPPLMTGPTKIFSIDKLGLFSSLCYICSIVGTVAFDKYYN
jgi:hypothetical protein